MHVLLHITPDKCICHRILQTWKIYNFQGDYSQFVQPSHLVTVNCKLRVQISKGLMICINNCRLYKYIWPSFLACREQCKKLLVICFSLIFFCRLQLLTKVHYRVAQLYEGTTYSLVGSINVQIKRLRKTKQVKTGAEHNNYFSFSKAYYCSAPQIHGCCY